MNATEPLIAEPGNAPRFWEWTKNRGGVAIWNCQDLARAGQSVSTPARSQDGNPTGRPSWGYPDAPDRIITDPQEILVQPDREIERFRIHTKCSGGLSWSLTGASSRKVRLAVLRAGRNAHYVFDDDEAVIMAAAGPAIPLPEWMAKNKL